MRQSPNDPLDPKAFLNGCLVTVAWLVASGTYLALAMLGAGRLGEYAGGATLLAWAVVPIAFAIGKPPFLRWPLARRWPGTAIDDPDDPDPSAGQGYWLAAAVFLIGMGIVALLRVKAMIGSADVPPSGG